MSAYGDLDHSLIDELPPGRKPINSVLLNNTKRAEVIERIHLACNSGQQVYWICPLIEASEVLQCEAAQDTAALLTQQLNNIKVGLVHGRLSGTEKAEVMAQFKAGHIQLLVATTVVEVGVDVPNANLMVIDNAERLGLAQLHQLRGRVGRGQAQSHCLFMYQAPLSAMGRERLDILRQSNDGFVIAERDLQLRGPGEVLGTRQAGAVGLRIADLMRDAHLLPEVKVIAEGYISYPHKTEKIISRWVGENQAFAKVQPSRSKKEIYHPYLHTFCILSAFMTLNRLIFAKYWFQRFTNGPSFPIIHLLNGVYNLREYTGSVIPKFSANNKNIFIICCTKNTKPLGGF